MEKYTTSYLKNAIENMWDATEPVQEQRSVLLAFLDKLDQGGVRIATRIESGWIVNEWVKKGILMVLKPHPICYLMGNSNIGNTLGLPLIKYRPSLKDGDFKNSFGLKSGLSPACLCGRAPISVTTLL